MAPLREYNNSDEIARLSEMSITNSVVQSDARMAERVLS